MQFTQQVDVARPVQEVWKFLWDIPQMAACVPGCTEAEATEDPQRFRAVVAERVGPFQVRFELEIRVTEVEEGRRIRATAQGKDSRVASQMKVDLEVRLSPQGEGTRLDVVTDVNVFGKLGALGHTVIKRKGDEILQRFAQALKARMEAVAA